MVEIKNLKKLYGDSVALDIESLVIPDSQTVVFAGPNGSGKTTLLRILAGSLKPTEGEIASPGRILYMPQTNVAFRGSVLDNVTIGLKESEDKALELLGRLELEAIKNQKASSLSGGEKQRMCLCRLLVRDCELLLLDEPTSACDALGAELIINEIARYKNRTGCSVVISTHSPVLASKAGDRLIILNGGRIEADGAPFDVLTKPTTPWAKSFIDGWTIRC